MQTGALEFSMILLTIFTDDVIVGIRHFLVPIQNTPIEIVVHTAFPQDGQKVLNLQLQSIRIFLGHYVVIEWIAFGEDIGGDE